jgi:hypothetical protein
MKKALLFLPIFLISCSVAEYQIKSSYDKFNDIRQTYMAHNVVNAKDMLLDRVSFNLFREDKKGQSNYFIHIFFVAPEWLFIEQGESLIMLVDGERIGFSGDGSINDREVISGGVTESAYYPIDKKFIKKLSLAKSVEFQLIGKGKYEFEFYPENYEHVKEFAAKCSIK